MRICHRLVLYFNQINLNDLFIYKAETEEYTLEIRGGGKIIQNKLLMQSMSNNIILIRPMQEKKKKQSTYSRFKVIGKQK